MTTNKLPSKTPFARWLNKNEMSYQAFARAANPQVSYSTVAKWARGTKPRQFFRDSLKEQFPDCPLFK